jgi:subtilisin family serine protease
MKTKSFPFLYFLILFLALVLSVVFWMIVLGFNRNKEAVNGAGVTNGSTGKDFTSGGNDEGSNWNEAYLPVQPGQIIPIDTNKIITDSVGQRRIVSNLVNIAIKNTTNSIAEFAKNLKESYPSDDYKIVYIDSVVNRLQVQLPEEARVHFKTEVKAKLKQYKLLVWDEVLFDQVKTFNDPQLTDKNASWYLKAININKAWDQSTGDKNIVIAVIDNGFDLSHPELKGKAVKPYNVIDKSEDVSPGTINHGTHVSSTIVANGNNGQGLVGICPGCSFMPVKVQDKNGMMSNSYVIDAILYAIKNKANIINLSLGMQIQMGLNIPLPEQMAYINSGAKDEEEFWTDLFKYADEKNVTCVIAAGNSDMMTGFDPFQRATGTIKVGAIDKNLTKAAFSNFGDKTTLYAPGTGIYGAKPGNSYEVLDGTSMAAPIVSGFIGLIKSKIKNISNSEVMKILNANTINRNNIRTLDVIANIN